MILKALFIGTALQPIEGLERRWNPDLSRMLCDYAHERWELDTLALLARGKTYSHIAQELSVSYKTVVNISWQLKKKLGVDNLSALVQKAIELLPPPDVLVRRSE